ncbi:MAG TPA: TadE/TadG family type IV pilus assembly protein [Pyrinomonadaceae bacterium]
MLSERQKRNQRGSVTTEFVLVVPLLALAMLLLLGLGYTMMTRQNAIVGARAAVFYQAPREQTVPVSSMNTIIKDAVSPGREEWHLEFTDGNMDSPNSGQVDIISGVISGIYQQFNKEISYKVSATPTLGFIPRIMDIRPAEWHYFLPRGTWTCAQMGGGSYTSVVLGGMGLPSPINGLFDLSCCETY